MAQANKINIIAGELEAYDFESISITASEKGLTSSKYQGSDGFYAKRVVITVEDAQIRYRYDGGTPTASEGHLANPMDSLVLRTSSNIQNFKAIRKGSTNGKIFVTYEK